MWLLEAYVARPTLYPLKSMTSTRRVAQKTQLASFIRAHLCEISVLYVCKDVAFNSNHFGALRSFGLNTVQTHYP
jgi:hypothetical protein